MVCSEWSVATVAVNLDQIILVDGGPQACLRALIMCEKTPTIVMLFMVNPR
ncbi:MAG: hypothetical protein ACJA12_000505 [Glaciecola sp.]|jgi:hypothetical protein